MRNRRCLVIKKQLKVLFRKTSLTAGGDIECQHTTERSDSQENPDVRFMNSACMFQQTVSLHSRLPDFNKEHVRLF